VIAWLPQKNKESRRVAAAVVVVMAMAMAMVTDKHLILVLMFLLRIAMAHKETYTGAALGRVVVIVVVVGGGIAMIHSPLFLRSSNSPSSHNYLQK